MRVRILVRVVDIPEAVAWDLIHVGHAELDTDDPASDAQAPGREDETYAVQPTPPEAAVTRRRRPR